MPPDLSTRYLGLTLKNPLVVGSCTYTIKPDTVARLAEAGAGAVVVKSIFEEQIRANVGEAYEDLATDMHPEALAYLQADLPMRQGPEEYLEHIREIRQRVDIPVIASINCTHGEQWTRFAQQVEAVGADALELNIYDVVTDPELAAGDVEARHLEIIRAVTSATSLSVAVKLSPYYTSLAHFARRAEAAGASGLVLFNRFLQPDVNTETGESEFHLVLSRPEDILLPLRWVAVLRSHVACDLALTTGVHNAGGAAKAILAGANAVQVCSALYARDAETSVATILDGLEEWMERGEFETMEDCRGLIQKDARLGTRGFERAQYVKALVGLE